MNLMPSEKILLESDGKGLVLTTHRVRYEFEALGSGEIRSIMLEELASCTMTRTSNPIFLIIAAICFVAGVYIGRDAFVGGVLALIFLVIYFVTRKQSLLLASAGATITYDTKGMSPAEIKKFIDRTEAAKNERYLLAKG